MNKIELPTNIKTTKPKSVDLEQDEFTEIYIKVIEMYGDAKRTECPLSELEKKLNDTKYTSCFDFYNTDSLDLIQTCIKSYLESINMSYEIIKTDPRFRDENIYFIN